MSYPTLHHVTSSAHAPTVGAFRTTIRQNVPVLCSASIVFVCDAVDEQLRHAAQNPIDALLRAGVNAQLILRLVKRRQGET